MVFDETLADRIRNVCDSFDYDLTERKMFGGLCFMDRGHMTLGVMNDELMVGPEQYSDALQQPHAREMDFTGRPLRGIVYVAVDGFDSKEMLKAWMDRALAFTQTFPAKGEKKKPKKEVPKKKSIVAKSTNRRTDRRRRRGDGTC